MLEIQIFLQKIIQTNGERLLVNEKIILIVGLEENQLEVGYINRL